MKFVELSAEDLVGAGFSSDNFLQSKEMYDRYVALGREVYILGVKDDKKIVAISLGLARKWHFGKRILRIAGGYLMDYDREDSDEILRVMTDGIKTFAKRRKIALVEISPNLVVQIYDNENKALGGPKYQGVKEILERLFYKYLGEYEQVKWVYTLDIEGKTEKEIWDGMRQSHRRMLRKAEKEGVKVRAVEPSEKADFAKIMAETGERQGFMAQGADYFDSMAESFKEKVEYLVAEREGEIVAVGMFVRYRKEMIYLYGGSRREMQKYGGSYLLQWEMIKKAIAEKCAKYNFYGVRPVEGDGVYLFKQGFRGQVEELIGSFALPIGVIGRLYAATLKETKFGKIK